MALSLSNAAIDNFQNGVRFALKEGSNTRRHRSFGARLWVGCRFRSTAAWRRGIMCLGFSSMRRRRWIRLRGCIRYDRRSRSCSPRPFTTRTRWRISETGPDKASHGRAVVLGMRIGLASGFDCIRGETGAHLAHRSLEFTFRAYLLMPSLPHALPNPDGRDIDRQYRWTWPIQ